MPTVRFEFDAAPTEENVRAVNSFMNALELFGHVGPRWFVNDCRGLAGVAATADVRSSAPERFGGFVRKALARAESDLGHVEILTSAVPKRRASSETLVLIGGVSRSHSPIEFGEGRGEVMPALTPLSEGDRRSVVLWQKKFRAFDHLWLTSGEFEEAAYRQVADVGSSLLKQGRELATNIEAATGKPTYVYVQRTVGYGDEGASRKCPDCRRPFAAGTETPGPQAFPFRCPYCRLVSFELAEIADDEASERLAAIGWVGRVPGR